MTSSSLRGNVASAIEIRQSRLKTLSTIYQKDGIVGARLMMLKMGLCWHTRRDYERQLTALHENIVA